MSNLKLRYKKFKVNKMFNRKIFVKKNIQHLKTHTFYKKDVLKNSLKIEKITKLAKIYNRLKINQSFSVNIKLYY